MNNSNIVILDRLKETKDVQCGNRLDKLEGNKCISSIYDTYSAQCPLNYTMYLVDNTYKCYKNCLDNLKDGEVSSINYVNNMNGKQCIKKTFIK